MTPIRCNDGGCKGAVPPGGAPLVRWQVDALGRRHIRAECGVCGRFLRFLKTSPANVARADASVGKERADGRPAAHWQLGSIGRKQGLAQLGLLGEIVQRPIDDGPTVDEARALLTRLCDDERKALAAVVADAAERGFRGAVRACIDAGDDLGVDAELLDALEREVGTWD